MGILLLFLFIFFSFVFIFFYEKHYLFVLLFFEVCLFSIFVFLLLFCVNNFGFSAGFMFLVVLVCMGAFSISLLVGVSRKLGVEFSVGSYVY